MKYYLQIPECKLKQYNTADKAIIAFYKYAEKATYSFVYLFVSKDNRLVQIGEYHHKSIPLINWTTVHKHLAHINPMVE